jgi:hypothetical protein
MVAFEGKSTKTMEMPVSICKTRDEQVVRYIALLERHLQSQAFNERPSLGVLSSLIKFNVYRALRTNNESLGFDMGWRTEDGLSPFFRQVTRDSLDSESYPPNLRPTALQRTIKHHPWIDLLPLPAMRDNILQRGDDYDDWPLCYDIVEDMEHARSGLIVWGDPWDADNW